MDLLIIGGAVVGSFAGAFYLQKAALEALFRAMQQRVNELAAEQAAPLLAEATSDVLRKLPPALPGGNR